MNQNIYGSCYLPDSGKVKDRGKRESPPEIEKQPPAGCCAKGE
jgi:hypothetical protein